MTEVRDALVRAAMIEPFINMCHFRANKSVALIPASAATTVPGTLKANKEGGARLCCGTKEPPKIRFKG